MNTRWASVFGALKLIMFVGSALLVALLISQSLPINLKSTLPMNELTITSVPLQYTDFPDVGKVASPHIDVHIITGTQSIPVTFLIDSGAKITALPMNYATQVGLDTSTAKRIYLLSATNNTTYGYLSSLTFQFGQKQLTLPVVYADVIEPLLGTYGFFDNYTIIFDSGQQITIKEKG